MPTARPLRDVFTDLVGNDGVGGHAADVLRANGHPDLPDALVAEAVVNYADTAPIELAEHLSPFVTANSPVPRLDDTTHLDESEGSGWLAALTSAPVGTGVDPGADLDAADLGSADRHAADLDAASRGPATTVDAAAGDDVPDFGEGDRRGATTDGDTGFEDLGRDVTAGLDAGQQPFVVPHPHSESGAPIGSADDGLADHGLADHGTDDHGTDGIDEAPEDPFDA